MTRREMIRFLSILWLCLVAAWFFSGEQFLDLMFSMPDAGPVDDAILTGVVWLEDWRAALQPPDLFAALRTLLHRLTGLG